MIEKITNETTENKNPDEYLQQVPTVKDEEYQCLSKGMCPSCHGKLKEQTRNMFRCQSCRRLFYV